ncbi:MAG: hypothetical protein JO332_10315 [Planctomycetaceae bacterium]|nr:hypothetical protein [Planctomycetaceae bacterium]
MPPKKQLQSVSCLCGANVWVDAMNRTRTATCKGCGNTFDFAVTVDRSSQNSRVSLILPKGAFKTEGESLANLGLPAQAEPEAAEFQPLEEAEAEAPPPPPPPPPPPTKGQTRISKKSNTIQTLMGHCECGTVFPLVDNGELTTVQSCTACGRSYHVVFKLEPGTRQKSAIIVPTKPVMHRRMDTTTPKAPKGATKVGKTVAPPAKARTKVGNTKVLKPATIVAPKPKAPVPVPLGAQAVPCGCGDNFHVRRKDLGQVVACAGCGRKARFEESRHPQTLVPMLRIKPD